MIFIINSHNDRWCSDARWRSGALWGSVRGCVRTYRRLGNAKRVAARIGGSVVQIVGDRFSVDLCGRVFEECPAAEPERVTNVQRNIRDFIVK